MFIHTSARSAAPRGWRLGLLSMIAIALAACAGQPAATPAPTPVTVMLDWTPNVNHTGLFVAQKKGFFANHGLEVKIIQPGEVYAEQAVASGAADVGISFQEQVTLARAQDQAPLVSIAAILQHNTSGFAVRAEQGVVTPKDWAGLRYGSFGSPFETPTLRELMACAGGDVNQVQIVETGYTDPLALLAGNKIDLAWIFYGTQGVAAEQEGVALKVLMMSDYPQCIPDYYTPVLIASEDTVAHRPAMLKAFLAAVSEGYAVAIQHPEEAATLLHEFAPETDEKVLQASQAWLAPRYQAEAPRWGEQQLSVWENYAAWMLAQGIIAKPLEAEKAFTNAFLP